MCQVKSGVSFMMEISGQEVIERPGLFMITPIVTLACLFL